MALSTQANARTVLVLGKSGGGKSTVANKILGNTLGTFFVAKSLGSQTSDISCKQVVLLHSHREYVIKVIDTMGLFDTAMGKSGNKEVVNIVKRYLLKEIPEGVNLILFVCRQGRWTNEEQETFDCFNASFRDTVKDISALVFTGCENLDERERKKLMADFTTDSTGKRTEITTRMSKGIYTVGFPDICSAPPALKDGYKVIADQDQEKLRQLVYSCSERQLSKEFVKASFWDKMKM